MVCSLSSLGVLDTFTARADRLAVVDAVAHICVLPALAAFIADRRRFFPPGVIMGAALVDVGFPLLQVFKLFALSPDQAFAPTIRAVWLLSRLFGEGDMLIRDERAAIGTAAFP